MSLETHQSTIDCAHSAHQFVFRCGECWFAIPATSVRELTMTPDVVAVPSCDPWLDGICRQQSEFTPVIALHALLDFAAPEHSKQNNQLLTLSGSNVWAIRIAEAIGLETLEIVASPEFNSDGPCQGVIGTATWGDKFVRVLNPDQLYQRTSQHLDVRWSRSDVADNQSSYIQSNTLPGDRK